MLYNKFPFFPFFSVSTAPKLPEKKKVRRKSDTPSSDFFSSAGHFPSYGETFRRLASVFRHKRLIFDTQRRPNASILEYSVVRGTPSSLAALATLPPVRTSMSRMSRFS